MKLSYADAVEEFERGNAQAAVASLLGVWIRGGCVLLRPEPWKEVERLDPQPSGSHTAQGSFFNLQSVKWLLSLTKTILFFF